MPISNRPINRRQSRRLVDGVEGHKSGMMANSNTAGAPVGPANRDLGADAPGVTRGHHERGGSPCVRPAHGDAEAS